MARRKRGAPSARFVAVSHRLMAAPVWRRLTGEAVKVYLDMARRFDGNLQVLNGQITYSAREGAAIGIGRTRTAEALDELARFRLIVCTAHHGRLTRQARQWRLTEFDVVKPNGQPERPTYDARAITEAEAERIATEHAASRRRHGGVSEKTIDVPASRTNTSPRHGRRLPNRSRIETYLSARADVTGPESRSLRPARGDTSISTTTTPPKRHETPRLIGRGAGPIVRGLVLQQLREAGRPLRLVEIVAGTGRRRSNLVKVLVDLETAGEIVASGKPRTGDRRYELASNGRARP